MSTLPLDGRYQLDPDRVVVLENATWADYQRLLEIRGEKSAPRFCFWEGTVEIMSPSRTHEGIKSRIGLLIEAWCFEKNVEFSPFGGWTLENKAKRGGIEPDECYVFHGNEEAQKPDLAIEVIWTSGRLDKRLVYEKLGVREVWFWKNDAITVFVLEPSGYRESETSSVLPGIDVPQLSRHLDQPVASRAVLAYRKELRGER